MDRAGVGALWFAGFVVLAKFGSQLRAARWITGAISVIGILLLIELIDPYFMIDTLSYAPYVGPAIAVRNGSVPMLDTFSQYGPNSLILAAAFSVFLTFFMTREIVAVLNTIMAIAFVFFVTRLSLNRLFGFAAGVFAVWFVHSSSPYNENYTPSVFAM